MSEKTLSRERVIAGLVNLNSTLTYAEVYKRTKAAAAMLRDDADKVAACEVMARYPEVESTQLRDESGEIREYCAVIKSEWRSHPEGSGGYWARKRMAHASSPEATVNAAAAKLECSKTDGDER